MAIAVPIFAAVAAVAFLLLWIFGPRALARLTTGLLLFAVSLFCIYGFMACFEYSEASSERITGQIVYGVLGTLCFVGALLLAWPRKRQP